MNKASRGDRIPAELLKILKDDSVKVPANLENSVVAPGLKKASFHSNSKEGNVRECLNYRMIVLISHASKIMLKILQTRLQQYMN